MYRPLGRATLVVHAPFGLLALEKETESLMDEVLEV